jgi:hypothetical protein
VGGCPRGRRHHRLGLRRGVEPDDDEIYITGATAEVELRAAATGGAEPAVIAEFPVPAYGGTAAAASAPHLRLVGLTRPLAAGDTVQLTLTTDGGATLKVTAPVRQP